MLTVPPHALPSAYENFGPELFSRTRLRAAEEITKTMKERGVPLSEGVIFHLADGDVLAFWGNKKHALIEYASAVEKAVAEVLVPNQAEDIRHGTMDGTGRTVLLASHRAPHRSLEPAKLSLRDWVFNLREASVYKPAFDVPHVWRSIISRGGILDSNSTWALANAIERVQNLRGGAAHSERGDKPVDWGCKFMEMREAVLGGGEREGTLPMLTRLYGTR